MQTRINILHIDDEQGFLELAKVYLERFSKNIIIDSVSSPFDALQRLETQKYDIIISDYQMPDLNGLEILKKLREAGNTSPFIILTGKGREEIAIEALNLGADYYLQKGEDLRSLFRETSNFIQKEAEKQEERKKRKHAEEALQQSQQLVQRTFESLREAVFIIDAATVTIIDCNPAASKIFGYTKSEMLGRTTEFLHIDPEKLEEFRKHLYPAIKENGFLFLPEFQMKRKDGTIFATEHNVMPLEDEHGNQAGWVSIVRDITKRKQAEEKVKENEARLSAILHSIPAGVLVVDPQSHRIVEINPTAVEMIGVTREQMISAPCRKYICPGTLCPITDVGQTIDKSECIVLTPNGEKLTVLKTVTSVMLSGKKYLVESFVEITKRKQMEKELREREEKYRALFEHTNDAVFIIDLDLFNLEVNQRAADMLGYSVDELTGMSVSQIVGKGEYEDSLYVKEALLAGEKVPVYERVFRRKDGSEFPVEIDVALVCDTNGSPPHFQSVVREITERKQAEETLKKAQVKLEHRVREHTTELTRTNERLQKEIIERKQVERALQESEEKYRFLFENAPVGIGISNMEGKIINYNRHMQKITGYSPEELRTLNIADTYVDLSERKKLLQELQQHKQVRDWELKLLRKDGTPYTALLNIDRIIWKEQEAVFIIVRDITEHKRVEKAHRESEEKFRTQFKNFPVPAYIWQKNTEDFVLVDYNHAAEEITKGKIQTYLKIRCSNFYADQPQVIADMNNCYANRTNIRREMIYKYKSTGEKKYLRVQYSYVQPEHIVVYTEDITERKRAEHKESEFLLDILSHDLKNYFPIALGYLDLVLEEVQSEKLT
ncbi:MAG: PAS domain S-box protein, partial [Candidatus Hodarchaeota archaeon]